MYWKEEIRNLCYNCCTDSDIEDFIMNNPDINAREIWDYVSEIYAPVECKGCKYIQFGGMFPCDKCSRRVKLTDYYEAR